jgi:predicted AAA+ superfamily ATPase
LRGARQVGKSTIVRLFAKERGLRLAEVNLERHPLLDEVFATLNLASIVSALEAICNQEFDDQKTLQFVAQELVANHQSADPPPLCYWLREGKKDNAEVDFVLQKDLEVVPIEVKSGSPGTLKSLAQFLYKTKQKEAVRVSNILPRKDSMTVSISTGTAMEPVKYTLLNVPIYLVGKLFQQSRIDP